MDADHQHIFWNCSKIDKYWDDVINKGDIEIQKDKRFAISGKFNVGEHTWRQHVSGQGAAGSQQKSNNKSVV